MPPTCPDCSSNMVFRQGKYGNFFACTMYPSCKGTRKINGAQQPAARKQVIRPASLILSSFTPSDEQKEVGKRFLYSVERMEKGLEPVNLIVPSVPGSGKTYMLSYLFALLNKRRSALACCFNANIRDTLLSKIPESYGEVLSCNQLGYRALINTFSTKMNENKLNDLLRSYNTAQPDDDKLPGNWFGALKRIVDMLKVNLLKPSKENIEECVLRYNIDVDCTTEFIAVAQMIYAQSDNVSTCDFTDQCFLAASKPVSFKARYDIILGDEVQDWNKCQLALLQKALLPGGFLVLVGDPNQSIYSWRGADPDAMDRMTESLKAEEHKLTVCRRCPKANVALASRLVPHIRPVKDAPQGNILDLQPTEVIEFLRKRRTGLLLARKNVHLAKWALKLLRAGIPAIIRGRDIAGNLISYLERFDGGDSLTEFFRELTEYREQEGAKLSAMGDRAASRLEYLNDQCDTLEALAEGLTTKSELKKRINELFNDEETRKITCSTIYRAKGDESTTVLIVGGEDFDKCWGTTEIAEKERKNILFVLITRTLFERADPTTGTTVFVGPRPLVFEDDETEASDD